MLVDQRVKVLGKVTVGWLLVLAAGWSPREASRRYVGGPCCSSGTRHGKTGGASHAGGLAGVVHAGLPSRHVTEPVTIKG